MLLFGCAMVIIMIWRPRGLVATRTPSMLLAGGKAQIAASIRDGNERNA
jgi:branched-chain amino acid transport system permease protein